MWWGGSKAKAEYAKKYNDNDSTSRDVCALRLAVALVFDLDLKNIVQCICCSTMCSTMCSTIVAVLCAVLCGTVLERDGL